MRRRLLLTDEIWTLPDGSKAKIGDIVLANKEKQLVEIVEGNKWSISAYPKTKYTPIGVVVIPGTHGVLKDGTGKINQCGVVSLDQLSSSWGYSLSDIENLFDINDNLGRYDSRKGGLYNYIYVNTVGSGSCVYETVQNSESAKAYLPSDNFSGTINPFDNKTSYYYNENYDDGDVQYAPSPYKNDGSYNTAYGQTTSPATSYNALSDFGGIVNTKILTDMSTAQSNWRTANRVLDEDAEGYYPAACLCARYKTTGTKAFINCSIAELRNGVGFWYLPAAGELGYLIPRFNEINDTVLKLIENYGVGRKIDSDTNLYSSSKYKMVVPGGYTAIRYISTKYGYMSYQRTSYGGISRPFMRL